MVFCLFRLVLLLFNLVVAVGFVCGFFSLAVSSSLRCRLCAGALLLLSFSSSCCLVSPLLRGSCLSPHTLCFARLALWLCASVFSLSWGQPAWLGWGPFASCVFRCVSSAVCAVGYVGYTHVFGRPCSGQNVCPACLRPGVWVTPRFCLRSPWFGVFNWCVCRVSSRRVCWLGSFRSFGGKPGCAIS